MKETSISKFLFIIIGIGILTSYSGEWEVFTGKNDVRDIALAGNTLWAATTGGVVAWNLVDNSYTSYTTTDGLFSCNINQVAIDKNGRPWVATKEPAGLFVYEDPKWKPINVGGTNNELADKIISGLEVDRFGNIWVYAQREFDWYINGLGLIPSDMDYIHGLNSGLYLWRYDGRTWHKHKGAYGPLALDPQKNLLAVDSLIVLDSVPFIGSLRFRIVSFNGSEFVCKWRSKVDDGLVFIALAHIALDSKGDPWISYYGERSGDTYGVVRKNTIYNTLDGLADDNVRSITTDGSGAVWCATDGGISKFTGSSWVTYDTTKGVASNLVYKILIGNDKTLYAATSKGISILKSNQWKTLKTVNEPAHNNYTDMVIDKRGAIILSGYDHIAIYDDLQWRMNYFGSIRVGSSEYDHFPDHNSNKSFIKSNDGTIYAIGNEIEKNWILKQDTGQSTFFKAFSFKAEQYNRILPIMSPAAACSGNDPCFWLTNGYGDLIWFNKQTTKTFRSFKFYPKRSRITCMLLDRDGRSVWVGYWGGIVHFDGNTVKKQINRKDGLASDYIIAIARDSSENLWFASAWRKYQSGGIAVLHDSKLTKYLEDNDGKVFGSCNALFVDKAGMVWTHADSGIARFDGSSWKLFESATVSPNLPYARYSHIIQDKAGTIWFGTEGSGILAYKDNRWYQFTTRDGIPSNSIRSCALDSKDNLWILTDYGIAMRKSDGVVHNQVRHDFINPGNNLEIQRNGKRFYVSSTKKPDMIRYTLFDLRGRAVLRQTIHSSKSFMLPEGRSGSGVHILSLTPACPAESKKKYFFKTSNIK